MSKLSEALSPTQTGYRAAKTKLKYVDVKQNITEIDFGNGGNGVWREYRIVATFGANKIVDRSGRVEIGEDAFYDVKRAIIEEIFGEFRPYLIKLRASLYEDDREEARLLLMELEQKMFQVK